ncbi:hypothetical protein N657DRAFT_659868 [Parathielavia appendiculata]|uniref:Telomeric repeat-binding factor 2-interacting protein 1 n=1 Tax=Parathielavia appendiculata TaxID=2587402 RepID=A0AAN6U804_9PEZI|nr:hypothetical protein N657DRAFT_659868 [Parathielavia appendiculata]
MAAPVVYEGVNGKYEGTLFNGIKFWVSQRVPTRSEIVGKIKDNGGKVVLLEKHADVLIDDHARKGCPPGSVSWKYINQSVANGELANVEEYRIHESTNPTRAIKAPYTKEDEQILVTWVRRAGKNASGNAIYMDLAKRYPQHSWQSWRDKWLKHLSLLPQNQLPPVLAELPPPRTRLGSAPEVAPAAAASRPKPAPPKTRAEATSGPAREPKRRIPFTEEDDRLLTEYVKQRAGASRKWSSNKIYQDFEEHHPHHSWHSWRDRWLRHLSLRDNQDVAASERGQQPCKPPATKAPPAQLSRSALLARLSPPAKSLPARPQPPRLPPKPPLHQRAHLARPPPTAPPISPTGPSGNGQGMTRLQDLAHKRRLIEAARTIQPAVKGWLLRRNLRRAEVRIAKFQARALGFLVRQAVHLTEVAPGPGATASFATVMPAPSEHDVLDPEEEVEELVPKETESDMVPGGGDEGSAYPQDDGVGRTQYHTTSAFQGTPVPEEPGSAIDEDDDVGEEFAPSLADSVDRSNSHPPPISHRHTPISPKEQFWRDFNAFNEINGLMPGPWVQIKHHVVDFWDLWRCATAEAHFDRNWGIVAERLGFDWVAEPHVPGELKAAFEKHLLEFETLVREFERQKEEEPEQGEENEDGEEDEEGAKAEEAIEEDVKEVEQEQMGRLAAPQTADVDFASSPPILGLKRARRSSAVLSSGSVRKRPRYDLSSEIPETPQTRPERAGEGVAAARAAAAGQQTPSRRPRVVQHTERHADNTALTESEVQDDDLLTSSQQLRSEIEAVPSVQDASQHLPRAPSSPDRPLPSVERDGDRTSNSSDAFESASKVRAWDPANLGRRRRVLELEEIFRSRTPSHAKDNGKDKKPAINTPEQPARALTTTTTTAQAQPSSAIHVRTSAISAYLGPPPASSSSNPPPTSATLRRPPPIDPATSMTHFISQGYPPHLVVRAVKATTDRQSEMSIALANTRIVLDSLVQGRGIPKDMARVWTEEEDRLLRDIGALVDGLRGKLPDRADRRPFGDGDGMRVLWRLVAKHGAEGMFDRREFLRVWDQV